MKIKKERFTLNQKGTIKISMAYNEKRVLSKIDTHRTFKPQGTD